MRYYQNRWRVVFQSVVRGRGYDPCTSSGALVAKLALALAALVALVAVFVVVGHNVPSWPSFRTR